MNEQQLQQEKLQDVRHTLAHLLGAAVLELYPDTKLTLGPAIDNGFYYDFDFSEKIGDEILVIIEKKMRELLPTWTTFSHKAVTPEEALAHYAHNEYKQELINEHKDAGLTFYTCGNFTDLCRGGHVEHPATDIPKDCFKLSRVAGAYWRGDEKNKMLTRIYGLAFESKEKLDEYEMQMEEAKKRDHRKLGKELELFTIIDEIGAGLPLFYPKGAILRRTIENFITEVQESRGFLPIWIPHITKGKLYEISGHLDKYDAMYTPMTIDGGDNYYLKPMNCPHFMMLYKTLPHSYRDLPVRYVSTTTNYRYEKSGELSGLTRVRSLTQDDCHVFCEPTKIHDEIQVMLEMIQEVYDAFGFNDFYVRISLRDSKNKSKYLGSDEVWNTAENALRDIVKKTGWQYKEAEDEAAFYGPKLDFMFKDAIGREWQLSTIQLDFNLPERFDLDYTNIDNKKVRPVVIHRAMLGSTERFMGIMIEHFAGKFPVWLSPNQVTIVPVNLEKHLASADELYTKMRQSGLRVTLDDKKDSLGKRIHNAKADFTPYVIVLGDKEIESGMLTVETRGEKIEGITTEDFIEKVLVEINNKTLN
jgi:threonyl-tRNA synthetase